MMLSAAEHGQVVVRHAEWPSEDEVGTGSVETRGLRGRKHGLFLAGLGVSFNHKSILLAITTALLFPPTYDLSLSSLAVLTIDTRPTSSDEKRFQSITSSTTASLQSDYYR